MARAAAQPSPQLALPLVWHQHVVCYSGGHSSALVAIEVVRRYGKAHVTLLNHDINRRVEDPDVKRFKREVADYLGLPITYANHERVEEWDQFDVVMHARAFKVGKGPELCTAKLKTEPFERWLKHFAPPGSATIYYGFDENEGHRILRRSTFLAEMGYESAFPLAHWRRTILSTKEIGIEPPLTYGVFKHANCVGCLKAGKQHWYIVFCTRPDIWARAKEAEDWIGYTIHDGVSLEELEPLFSAMRDAEVEPTEHIPQQTFWADAKRRVRLKVMQDLEPTLVAKPCECATMRRGPRRKPPCTCGAPHGTGHALVCAQVMGERWAA